MEWLHARKQKQGRPREDVPGGRDSNTQGRERPASFLEKLNWERPSCLHRQRPNSCQWGWWWWLTDSVWEDTAMVKVGGVQAYTSALQGKDKCVDPHTQDKSSTPYQRAAYPVQNADFGRVTVNWCWSPYAHIQQGAWRERREGKRCNNTQPAWACVCVEKRRVRGGGGMRVPSSDIC